MVHQCSSPPHSPRRRSSTITAPPPAAPKPLLSHLQFDFGVPPRLNAEVGEVPLEGVLVELGQVHILHSKQYQNKTTNSSEEIAATIQR